LLAAPVLADRDSGTGPALLVPAKPDSTETRSPAAPLLIPGRPYAADTLRKTQVEIAQIHLRKARKLESDGLPQQALVEYQNAVAMDPTVKGAFLHMGMLFEGFGVMSRAVEAYALEVQHHPENREAARRLGVALVRVGEVTRGVQQLELLTRRYPTDGACWRSLGYAYTNAKRFKEAEHALRQAIALPPPEAEEYRDLGVLLANRGRETEARAAYQKAARLDPKDGSVWINLGNLEMRAGRTEAALADYRVAEARDSSSTLAYRAQVQALTALGRETEVGTTYRRWLTRVPDDANARLEAVRWFVSRDRTDVALEVARDGVRHAPHSGDAHLVMGVAWGAAGDARSSLLEFRRAEHYLGPDADPSQVHALIAELRANAPDSLRRLFVADSLAAEARAHPDSSMVPGFTGPGSRKP
jgi:Flp pilus assembly protein TadD